MEDNYVFFWSGPLSNFDSSHQTYMYGRFWRTSEQLYMLEKAKYFGDHNSSRRLSASYMSPKEAKKIGRGVIGFDHDEWERVKYRIMLNVIREKFKDPYYRKILIDTGSKILVEASPYDRSWGIGYRSSDALEHIDNWGENLLGKALMEIRKEIIENISK